MVVFLKRGYKRSAVAILLNLLVCSHLSAQGSNGAVVLSFDDTAIKSWYDAHNVLKEYGWKATFYISHFEQIFSDANVDANVRMLRELQDYGHEIGAHGWAHLSILSHLDDIDGYLEVEVFPMILKMEEYGFYPTSYSYPGGGRTAATDTALWQIFPLLRTVTSGEPAYPKWNNRLVASMGIDNMENIDPTRYDRMINTLETARTQDRAAMLYGHTIVEKASGSSYTVELQRLIEICEYAVQNDMQFMTMTELARPPVYGIRLDTDEHIFDTVSYGYDESQSALAVTVSNTGNRATGELTIALSGEDADAFVLSGASISNISSIAAIEGNNTKTFTVAPKAGLAVGTYTASVTVSGANDIEQSFDVSFTVNRASAPIVTWPSAAPITYGTLLSESMLSGGSTQYGEFAWSAGAVIPVINNSGYSVTFTPNAAALANYYIDTVLTNNVAVTVLPKALTEEMLYIPEAAYNGAPRIPILTVTDHDMGELTRNIDYTVTLTPQTNAGTYPITVTGIGNYTGTSSVNFVIRKGFDSLTADMLDIPAVTYNGIPQAPVLTVTDGTETLVRNRDYTVDLTPRTNAGIYAVSVTGIGGYEGTAVVDFIIAPKALTEEMLSIPVETYNGAAYIPDLTVVDYDIGRLVRNIDYTVTLTPRTDAGTYPVAVTGIGNYTGTSSVNFVIDYSTALVESDRVIPSAVSDGEAVVVPVNNVTGGFRAGPNPVSRLSGGRINFFTNGSGNLRIYNANGNLIREVQASDGWDLKDGKGRLVPAGSYLVHGTITAADGNREKVSVILGVR